MLSELYEQASRIYTDFILKNERENQDLKERRKENLKTCIEYSIQSNLGELRYSVSELMKYVMCFPDEKEVKVILWLPNILPVHFIVVPVDSVYYEFREGFFVTDLLDYQVKFEFGSLDMAIGCSVQRVKQIAIPCDIIESARRKASYKLINVN